MTKEQQKLDDTLKAVKEEIARHPDLKQIALDLSDDPNCPYDFTVILEVVGTNMQLSYTFYEEWSIEENIRELREFLAEDRLGLQTVE